MKSLILAVDFDGTICELSYPEVGVMRKGADIYLRQLKKDGHTIIINTCRTGRYEGLAQDFLEENGIPFDYINSNLPSILELYKQDCRKISADVYIDDKCLMGLPEWSEIYKIINENFVNS